MDLLNLRDGLEVARERRLRLDGDDRAAVLPDALEQLGEELAALGGGVLDLPEACEIVEQRLGAGDAGIDRRADALDLLLHRLATHQVLTLGEVAHDVEVLETVELGEEVAATLGLVAGLLARGGVDRVDHEAAQLAVGLEVAQPLDELVLQRLCLDDRLSAVSAAPSRSALVAAVLLASAARALHPCVAALAVEELAQQVVLGRAAWPVDAGPPRADLLYAVEQLLGHDRLMPAADLARLVAQAGDVAAVRGVDEHLPHGVFRERAPARGARAFRAEPGGDAAVGLLSGRVALVHPEDEWGALGVGHDLAAVRVAHVAPRQAAYEVALSRLLSEPRTGPKRERDGVVLVEHLMDRLGEKRGRVARVLAHRLGDGEDLDAEPLAQQLLVAAGLDLVTREPRRVEDQHDVEALLSGVGHQPLEVSAAVGLAPAGVEVAVLLDDGQTVLCGELRDRLALRVGREALSLLLGRLAHVHRGTDCWRRCVSHGCSARVGGESAAAAKPPVREPAREVELLRCGIA